MSKIREDASRVLDIDKDSLDVECVAQPKLYHSISAQLADAVREESQAEAELKLVDAELDHDIRLHPEKYGLEKTTEPSIKAAVLRSQRHKDAFVAAIDAKHEVDVFKGLLIAAQQRKSSLEDLVKLRLADYYSEVKLPRGERERRADGAFGGRRDKR